MIFTYYPITAVVRSCVRSAWALLRHKCPTCLWACFLIFRFSVDKVVYLRTLFVFKEHRCKGKATRLIKAAKDICKSQLGTNIFVALCSNPVATRAFLKAGFELVEELHYTEIDFPGLQLMSKEFLKTSDKISVVAKTD